MIIKNKADITNILIIIIGLQNIGEVGWGMDQGGFVWKNNGDDVEVFWYVGKEGKVRWKSEEGLNKEGIRIIWVRDQRSSSKIIW